MIKIFELTAEAVRPPGRVRPVPAGDSSAPPAPTSDGAPGPLVYPVALRLEGRPCLVVGGGPVALGKVDGLLAAGAVVTVVAPELHPDLTERAARIERAGAGRLTLERRPYRPGEAAHYRLVVTATGVAVVDRTVAGDAEAAGVWVNSADDPANCAFFVPSVHRDGTVTVAVSTGGASPALAAWIRRRVAEALGPGVGTLALLLAEARDGLRAAGRPTQDLDWAALLDGPLPDLVADGRLAEARAVLDAFTGGSDRGTAPPDRYG